MTSTTAPPPGPELAPRFLEMRPVDHVGAARGDRRQPADVPVLRFSREVGVHVVVLLDDAGGIEAEA